MTVNISLRMSGILAFFAVLVMTGSWALTIMSTSGVLDIDTALRGLGLLYIASIVCVCLVYGIETDM